MSFHIYQAKLELSLIVINTSEVTFPIVLPNEKQKYNWKIKKCSKLDFFSDTEYKWPCPHHLQNFEVTASPLSEKLLTTN